MFVVFVDLSFFFFIDRESSNWKTNVGSSILQEIEMEARWKKWADYASQAFGGLDILTVDVMHKGINVSNIIYQTKHYQYFYETQSCC